MVEITKRYFNIEKYQKESNILFITGLVGSGESTLAKELGEDSTTDTNYKRYTYHL